MMNYILFSLLLISTIACSSATQEVNQRSAEVSSGVGALENAANTVDRAIATEKRIRERYKKK